MVTEPRSWGTLDVAMSQAEREGVSARLPICSHTGPTAVPCFSAQSVDGINALARSAA